MMKHRSGFTVGLAALAISLVASSPRRVFAQGLANRVASAPDGQVHITYAARDGVCGDGRTFIADDLASPGGFTMYTNEGMNFSTITGITSDFRGRCDTGPVRVIFTVSERRVVDVRPYVGWRSDDSRGTDLGTVSAVEAARYLLTLAADGEDRVTRNAMLAASVADSALVAPTLLTMARNKGLRAHVRDAALKWLERTASREGYAAADEGIRAIVADEDDARVIRERAIRVLSSSSQNDAFLRGLYGRMGEQSLKERIIRELAESGTEANSQWIKQVALDARESVSLRERAIRVLGEETGKGSLARDLYPQLDQTTLKERVLRTIGEHGDAVSMKFLRTVAEDASESPTLRDRAIRILGEHGEGSYVRAMYPQLNESALKERVIRVAAEAGGRDNLAFLREVSLKEGERSDLRDRAIRSLSESGVSTAELAKLYDGLTESSLRDRLIRLFAERGDKAGIDKLVDIAKNDENGELRRRAIRKLAESGDPRAKQFLEDRVK